MAGWIRKGPWLQRYEPKDVEALPSYCVRELDRWHERLVRKGRRLKTLGASRRHRLRIKAKRFRYMLEALTESRRTLWSRGDPSPAPAGKAIAARLGRHARSRAPRRPGRRGATGRKWQTRQQASAGLSPTREKLLGAAIAASRPQACRDLLTCRRATASDVRSDVSTSAIRSSVALFAAIQEGAASPRESVEKGDVQEHSGSYSLRASGQAGY